MEMNELPEENDVHSENYKKVPIEDFGRALLRGMGWDGKTGLDSKTYVQISSIEKEVNNIIFQGLMVKKRVEDIQDAIDSGATALFGEKYSDIVRVVEVDGYSVELCGGCHTDNTVSIGLFKIISESSVASGVRRIEALTGSKALEYLSEAECINKNIGAMLKCSQGEIVSRVSDLIENAKETERLKKEAEDRIAARAAGKMADDAREINGIKALSVKRA